MSASDKEIFEFDSFRLDPAERLLLRDSEPVPLEPKVFETLLVLIRHSGRLVSKEELMQQVWPDSFVEESNLVRNISILRKALSRSDGGPAYIETVPKRGYRFVGLVRALAGEQTELIVLSARVSVVVEEEESDRETARQGDQVTRRGGEIATVIGEWLSNPVETTIPWRGQTPKAGCRTHTGAVTGNCGRRGFFFGASRQAIDSIAVLPFVNVDANPDTEYLSDGITDSLINSLSQLPNLKVMSRNSVFRYKGNGTDAQQAGSALGVRAVLTGKVTQRGNDSIVSAELVDVRNNSHLWGEQFNRKLSDLLAVQTELSRDISQQLRLKLSNETQQRLARRDTENPEAYEASQV